MKISSQIVFTTMYTNSTLAHRLQASLDVQSPRIDWFWALLNHNYHNCHNLKASTLPMTLLGGFPFRDGWQTSSQKLIC